VTGVQTCALPISPGGPSAVHVAGEARLKPRLAAGAVVAAAAEPLGEGAHRLALGRAFVEAGDDAAGVVRLVPLAMDHAGVLVELSAVPHVAPAIPAGRGASGVPSVLAWLGPLLADAVRLVFGGLERYPHLQL